MEISFIIATHNGWEYVDRCLRSLALDETREAIVIDNASTDGTPEKLRLRYPHVRLHVNAVNLGHCHAINQGISLARGEYITVLDGDTVLEEDAAGRLRDFLKTNPNAVIAAPRMLNPDGTIQETARSFPTVANGIFGRQSLITKWFPNSRFVRQYLRRDAASMETPFQVDWVSAACLMFHRSLPERIGPWDEGFEGYWVDADWCKTAHGAGSIYCVPAARVLHFEQNRAGRKKGARRIAMFHRGVFRFYRKHQTKGWLDPRALFAAGVLALRCGVLIACDWLRPAERPQVAAKQPAIGYLEGESHD